jgi:adenylosuccinate lyase
MGAIWSEVSKYSHWLKVEILATEARAQRGEVPQEDLAEIKERASFDIARIADLERKTRHDVAAFVDNVSENIGLAARHLHYGMTSSDVLDTALAVQLRDSSDLLIKGLDRLINVVITRAREHQDTLMAARTHGIHAEPMTFGLKLASWAFELGRGRTRIRTARETVSVGKLSGAVGTYSQLPPDIEAYVCEKLGLRADEASTQVVSRDRHAEFLATLANVAATIERIAVEIRHLARTEVSEVQEAFAHGEQKGSSAMPHKRNPIRSERLTGLARLLRGHVVAGLDNVALWHERDISHSSVERVILPDSCIVLDYMIAEATELIEHLEVDPERMIANIDASFGLLFSQSVLLALVDKGASRDEAYRMVQEAASKAWDSKVHLSDILIDTAAVAELMDAREVRRCFDRSRYLSATSVIIGRLKDLET